jgi:shikimate kinase
MAFFIIQPTSMRPEHPSLRTVERIVLIGFMGAGKSTVGPILAERLGWRFADADRRLELEAGAKIADLFPTLGEPAFRRMEAEVAARLCAATSTVVALGGGALETEPTRILLRTCSNTCVVFLEAPLEVLVARCERQPNAAIRPVLRQREALEQRFHSRLPHYQSAHLTVSTDELDPGSVANKILEVMLERGYAIPLVQKAIAT